MPALRLFLFSIKVEFGFGYVFAQCVFKACLESHGRVRPSESIVNLHLVLPNEFFLMNILWLLMAHRIES